MSKENNTIRYVIKNNQDEYVNSYSTSLGDNIAYKYAQDCAKQINGVVLSQYKDGSERVIYSNLKSE